MGSIIKEKFSLSLLGYGWLGQALTNYWDKNHPEFQYFTFSRSGRQGSTPFYISADTSELPKEIIHCDALIFSIPPSRDVDAYCQTILKLTKLLPSFHRVIMIGTTSVFEGNDGLCTEQTNPIPCSERSKKLREAEEIFLYYFVKGLIIRSAGQIGPDRAPARFLAKKEDPKQLPQGNVPVNIIHRDDIVRICTLAVTKELTGILHAVSPYHPYKSDYYQNQAKSLGLKLLEFPTGNPSQKKIEANVLKDIGYSFINEKCEL